MPEELTSGDQKAGNSNRKKWDDDHGNDNFSNDQEIYICHDEKLIPSNKGHSPSLSRPLGFEYLSTNEGVGSSPEDK